VAETDTVALELSSDTLFEIFDENFAILQHVLREVSRQIVEHLVKYPQAVFLLTPSSDGPPTPPRELDLVERIFLLRKSPVFRRASISALGQLARGLTEVRMPPGTRLWQEGETTGWGSMIVSGSVRCTSSRGHDFAAGPGIVLGSLDAVAEVPRWFTAVTETPVVALQTNLQYLVDVFEDNFAMALDYLAVQAGWLLQILDRSLASRERLTRMYGCEPEADSGTNLVVPVGPAAGPAA
jgi:CRP-like cAMP-binding protein